MRISAFFAKKIRILWNSVQKFIPLYEKPLSAIIMLRFNLNQWKGWHDSSGSYFYSQFENMIFQSHSICYCKDYKSGREILQFWKMLSFWERCETTRSWICKLFIKIFLVVPKEFLFTSGNERNLPQLFSSTIWKAAKDFLRCFWISIILFHSLLQICMKIMTYSALNSPCQLLWIIYQN